MPTKKDILLEQLLKERGLTLKDLEDLQSPPNTLDHTESYEPVAEPDEQIKLCIVAGMPHSGEGEMLELLDSMSDKSSLNVYKTTHNATLCALVEDLRNTWSSVAHLGPEDKVKFFSGRWANVDLYKVLKEDLDKNLTRQLSTTNNELKHAVAILIQTAVAIRAMRKTIVLGGVKWLPLLELLKEAYDSSVHVIVPIREFPEILAAEELKERAQRSSRRPLSETIDYAASQSLLGRATIFASNKHSIGVSTNLIHDAYNRGHKDEIMFVLYGDLMVDTDPTMQAVYDFLNIPVYGDFHPIQTFIPIVADTVYPNGIVEPYKKTWELLHININE